MVKLNGILLASCKTLIAAHIAGTANVFIINYETNSIIGPMLRKLQ